MPLMLPEHWVWDFWIARDGALWHLFFLKAPKSLGNPERRHRNATIGHAVSVDLRSWEIVGDPFEPGSPGAWDDLANWTGSIVKHESTWWMFYTGVSTADDGRVQRVGAAVSPDLSSWEKAGDGPFCVADSRWYERFDPDAWYEEAWRDPWVLPDPDGRGFHMFLTARAKDGPPDRRGVVGRAVSEDLETWVARPPVYEPGSFGHLEVPQQISIQGRHFIVFSVPADMQPDAPDGGALTGIGYATADTPIGPYRPGPTAFVYGDRPGRLYAGRVVVDGDRAMLIATRHHDADGAYIGTLADPMPLIVTPDGGLALAGSPV